MAYRYYTLYRPPMPGTVPRHDLERVECFDERTKTATGVMAWGYADYSKPLTEEEIREYELMPFIGNPLIYD